MEIWRVISFSRCVIAVVRVREDQLNVAEAKKRLSDLLERVAYRKKTILITRGGRPMARLVPLDQGGEQSLADLRGWQAEDDAFLAAVDQVPSARAKRPHTYRSAIDSNKYLSTPISSGK